MLITGPGGKCNDLLLTRTYFESQGKSAYVVRATGNLDPSANRRAA